LRFIYSWLIRMAVPFAFALVLWRGVGDRSYWQGLAQRFGFGRARALGSSRLSIWLHAVSLGEMSAAAPLVRELRARYPQRSLVVTTATPAGRARALALFADAALFTDAADIRFLPYDTPGSVRRFLPRIQPCVAIIMETELWPNLFNECRRRGIPVVLANARISPKSVARYRRFGGLFRDVFADNTLVAAQSTEDAERFIAIGADPDRTRVVGNVKFDVGVDAAVVERGLELRSRYWDARPVWIAGSTHAGEEELVLTAHAGLQADVAGALLLLVPRHPERFQSVADLVSRRGFRFERRSSGNAVRPDSQVLLVDTVGELAALYASVDVAFVGGSLVPVGGHNLLEPAALGVPVITGPYQSSGKEIAQLLLQQGAALQVADAPQLTDVLRQLFADPARRQRVGASGRQVVAVNRGSVARLLELIAPLLSIATPG
jgi:3-deoxy-D-manno-octulosonic-acid transferase